MPFPFGLGAAAGAEISAFFAASNRTSIAIILFFICTFRLVSRAVRR